MTTHLIEPPTTGVPVATLCCSRAPHQLPPSDRLAWRDTIGIVDCPQMTPEKEQRTPQPARPWGADTLAAPRGSEREARYAAIRRLDDGSVAARLALKILGVQDEEFGRW